ncbi:MAG: polyprenyl synthetase family protein [Acidobacteria bacterium]|nr:polyprenyl synthetase family protein [Acidobacteriota bacterium]MBI1983677.1 polyprenyl synthetase family protein [Acidobacteriota bacterium]
MRHSVFAGGKRIRPILCLESGRLFDGDVRSLIRLGCALELIHTYSLIHDDLPALDNDDLRRGKPTCHRAFGEATAILAGDALLTLAFEVLSGPGPLPEEQRLRVVHELSHAIGTRAGMVGGQVVDLETNGQTADADTLLYIHAAKTGAFIRAAVRCGAIYADAQEDDLARVTTYGEKIGLAFQVVDDLLDVLGSKEELGKEVRKDKQQLKATYPGIHGVAESRRIASRLVSEACDILEPLGERACRLQEIAHFLIARTH